MMKTFRKIMVSFILIPTFILVQSCLCVAHLLMFVFDVNYDHEQAVEECYHPYRITKEILFS